MPAIQIDAGQGIGAIVLAVLTILGTVWVMKVKTKSDETTAHSGASETVWKQVEAQLKRQDEAIQELKDENKDIRAKLDAIYREKGRLENSLTREQSLSSDLAWALLAWDEWYPNRDTMPRPILSPHLQEHLRLLRAA